MQNNKIVPCLWYSVDGGKMAGLVEYYKNIFSKYGLCVKLGI